LDEYVTILILRKWNEINEDNIRIKESCKKLCTIYIFVTEYLIIHSYLWPGLTEEINELVGEN